MKEKVGISAEMSVRLSKAFGSSPETWLRMQVAYDLWQIGEREGEIEVESFRAHTDLRKLASHLGEVGGAILGPECG